MLQGRPNDNYSVDPVGSVSIIRIGDTNEFNRVNFHLLQHSLNVTNLNFTSYTSINSIINSNNARINGIVCVLLVACSCSLSFALARSLSRIDSCACVVQNATIANSLEPSFITLNDFAYTPRAYVTCQINNVFIEIDLIKNKIVRLTALPFRDFSTKRNGFDASDADNAINIAQWPVKGIPGPYGAAFFFFNDRQYLAFANQGKARVNSAYNEQRVVKNVQLDPNRFNATQLQAPAALGDLVVSVNGADTNNDGKFDQLYAFGSRSISVWMLNTSSSDSQIYESGDSLERSLAAANANTFNSAATNPTNTFDARSPYSGAEPSAVVIGKIGTKKLLFVALAQQSTIVAYSLSNPKIPRIVAYSGDYDANPSAPVDQQPADLIFIPNNRNVRLAHSPSASQSVSQSAIHRSLLAHFLLNRTRPAWTCWSLPTTSRAAQPSIRSRASILPPRPFLRRRGLSMARAKRSRRPAPLPPFPPVLRPTSFPSVL